MKFGLSEDVILMLNKVFRQFPAIKEVVIYGSRAKGNFREGSDIDLTLKGNSIDLALLNQLELKIDDLMLPYKFDISIYNKLQNKEFIDHIQRIGKVFYNKDL